MTPALLMEDPLPQASELSPEGFRRLELMKEIDLLPGLKALTSSSRPLNVLV